MFSTSGVFITPEGYHEYIRGGGGGGGLGTMMHVGDTTSTLGDVQYIGGIS